MAPVSNDPQSLTGATNYFTILGVHQWAWKKGHEAFEKAKQHWPITTPWIDYADEVSLVLGIDATTWRKMYDQVEHGFKILPPDTYVIQLGQSLSLNPMRLPYDIGLITWLTLAPCVSHHHSVDVFPRQK